MCQPLIPRGYCRCGCGEKTNIATANVKKDGWIKGQPLKYVRGHNRRLSGLPYAVEDRGYKTPCWIWKRSMTTTGYGRMRNGGKCREAYTVYFERIFGLVPEGKELDHLCKIRTCVNPFHLEPVLRMVNVQRGRQAKLTPELVREIRERHGGGELPANLSKAFGVCVATIWNVTSGTTWRNVL